MHAHSWLQVRANFTRENFMRKVRAQSSSAFAISMSLQTSSQPYLSMLYSVLGVKYTKNNCIMLQVY